MNTYILADNQYITCEGVIFAVARIRWKCCRYCQFLQGTTDADAINAKGFRTAENVLDHYYWNNTFLDDKNVLSEKGLVKLFFDPLNSLDEAFKERSK